MEFCAQQQLFNPPPPPPSTTKRCPSPAAPSSTARASWPRPRHPAVGLLCWSSRRPSLAALQVTTASTTTNAARSSDSEGICFKNIILDTKLPREGKFFELEMTVRDCDLDVYGVVNNAVYAGYIETARQEMAARLGVCTGSIVRTGRAMALSELNVKYFAPLKRGAKFVVMVRVVQIKGVRMFMEHLIATLPDRKLVLEAMATVVCLNQDYRPTRMFPEMANLLHFFSHPSN
ncbi:acyl-acyl carrier protein thioesterase ATL4, chloroplastic [Sorghum bicolor]|uniref:Thioesterase domain-containing protein n=1 Tax=Sorghum bicolor TaxID=4558 RepID=C5Y1H8_SORBI|nr:acyl-acyl carrier protein thioesterase ATL4, chloroplastic [Sorghum bicolor]EES05777.1 hypothetical protein SORBI_3004G293900 [Sorghum bicolor]|eukprot:XP_002452801.1 acyl-acyl carrier protein thioesterase ATL4, chloroplastic [Sorghum bicolor]